MLQALATESDIFKKAKNRALKYVEDGLPDCDPGLVNVIRYLTEFDGIAPLWCCESHPTNDTGNFYVSMAANEKGVETLINLFAAYRDEVMPQLDVNVGCTLQLEFSCLHAGLFEEEGRNYRTVNITCWPTTEDEKLILLRALRHVVTLHSYTICC